MGKKRIPREVVLAMRKQHQAGYTIEAIRIAYGYTRKTVSDLVNHKTHKRVRLAPNDSRDVPPLPPATTRTPEAQAGCALDHHGQDQR